MTQTLRELHPARDLVVEGDMATVPSDSIALLLPRDHPEGAVALLRERVAALREHKLGAFRGR